LESHASPRITRPLEAGSSKLPSGAPGSSLAVSALLTVTAMQMKNPANKPCSFRGEARGNGISAHASNALRAMLTDSTGIRCDSRRSVVLWLMGSGFEGRFVGERHVPLDHAIVQWVIYTAGQVAEESAHVDDTANKEPEGGNYAQDARHE